jgi:hypothetical protein
MDAFDRQQGIIDIMACFLDEFVPRLDWTEEKGTSYKTQSADFISHSVGPIIADHYIHPTPPQF